MVLVLVLFLVRVRVRSGFTRSSCAASSASVAGYPPSLAA